MAGERRIALTLPILSRLLAKRPAPTGRTTPLQLPNDFKSLPLVRSWAVQDGEGNLTHHQIRRCPATRILLQASASLAEGRPVTVKRIGKLSRWPRGS